MPADKRDLRDTFLINFNRKHYTVKVYDKEFRPRKKEGGWVPDLLATKK